MADQFARAVARFVARCRYVESVHDLITKQRVVLAGEYILDLFFNASLNKYSYTLVREEQRVLGWDNALHYPDLRNAPHHFHREDGTVVPSTLSGVPEDDMDIVAAAVNAFLAQQL